MKGNNNQPHIIEIKTLDFSNFGVEQSVENLNEQTNITNNVETTDQSIIDLNNKVSELEKRINETEVIRNIIEESLSKIIRSSIPLNVEDDISQLKNTQEKLNKDILLINERLEDLSSKITKSNVNFDSLNEKLTNVQKILIEQDESIKINTSDISSLANSEEIKNIFNKLFDERLKKDEEEAAEQKRLAEEEEAKRILEEQRQKEEADRLAKEEADRLAKEEADRLAKEEAERILEEQRQKEEAERILEEQRQKEEADRLAKEEADRLAKEEADRLAEEQRQKEEEERLAKEEADRLAKEEADRLAKEEADRLAKEEAYEDNLEELLNGEVKIEPNPGYTLYLYFEGDYDLNDCVFGVYMKKDEKNILVGKTTDFLNDSGKRLIIVNVNLSENGTFSEFRLLCNGELIKPTTVPELGLIKIGSNTFTDLRKIPEIIF